MSSPTYMFRKMQILMLADTPEASAAAGLIKLKDRDGWHRSEWWGHPEFSTLPDGTTLVKVPLNGHNILKMSECGAVPANDPDTLRRIMFFKKVMVTLHSDLPLMPFQRDGAEWLLKRDLRALLAFGVGLGKSLTSLAAMLSDPGRFFPCVILAPAHVKLNWENEWVKWGGHRSEISVLFGRTPDIAEVKGRKVIVLNQHIVAGWAEALIAVGPKSLVVDEAHNFVNSNTKTYPVVEKLAEACGRHVLLLTATPVVNNLGDLWGLYNLICPDILGNKGVFCDTFMPEEKAKQKLLACRWRGEFKSAGWGEVMKKKLPKAVKERRIAELRDLLHRTVVLFKRKSEVVTQLPDVTETNLRIEIPRTTPEGIAFWDIEEECAAAIEEAKDDVLATERGFVSFQKAKANAATARIPYAIEWIEDFLQESEPTEKLVIAGWSVAPLQTLAEHFGSKALLINGEVEAKKKKILADQFATDPGKRLLFGNYKSIGTGIDTLVVASTMLVFELPLTSVDFEQIKGRIDRLSQKSQKLAYYYMLVKGAIEEKKGWAMIKSKKGLADALGM